MQCDGEFNCPYEGMTVITLHSVVVKLATRATPLDPHLVKSLAFDLYTAKGTLSVKTFASRTFREVKKSRNSPHKLS